MMPGRVALWILAPFQGPQEAKAAEASVRIKDRKFCSRAYQSHIIEQCHVKIYWRSNLGNTHLVVVLTLWNFIPEVTSQKVKHRFLLVAVNVACTGGRTEQTRQSDRIE